MKKVNNSTKRVSMSVLLVFALFTTFQTISGVEAKAIIAYAYPDYKAVLANEGSYFSHKFKILGLAFKKLKKLTNFERKFPLAMQLLEQYLNWKMLLIGQDIRLSKSWQRAILPDMNQTERTRITQAMELPIQGLKWQAEPLFNDCSRFECISNWDDSFYPWLWIWRGSG